jgi:hypothetical protein
METIEIAVMVGVLSEVEGVDLAVPVVRMRGVRISPEEVIKNCRHFREFFLEKSGNLFFLKGEV